MIPETIQIGPHVFTLTVDTAAVNAESVRSRSSCIGYTSVARRRIYVSGDDELSGTMQRETVLHECLHVLFDAAGLSYGLGSKEITYTEEALLQALDTPLLGLLRANPQLLAWLTETPESTAS